MDIEEAIKKCNDFSYISPNLDIDEIPVEEGFCTSSYGPANTEQFGRNNEDW